LPASVAKGRQKVRKAIQRFLLSRRGNVAIVTALLTPALVGFAGLGTETAYWYYRQRSIQAAADIAAFDSTLALRNGAQDAAIEGTAETDSVKNGWRSANGTITVNTPPKSGSHQDNKSVEVLLTENQPRYFTALFSRTPVPIRVRAVATYESLGTACMLGLNKNQSRAVQFWGNASAKFEGCNIVSDSSASDSFAVGGSANVTTPCASTVGGSYVTSVLHLTECPQVVTNAAYTADPYASLPAPPVGTCHTGSIASTLDPGTYCGGLSFGSGTYQLNPGVYVINGGTLKINSNSVINGSGVMFYLTNGATLQLNGSAKINISAATTGTYGGVLFYGDRTMANAKQTINGDASSLMTGVLYFPSQELDLLGNFSGAGGCMQVVADTIYYTGSSTFRDDCATAGLKTIAAAGNVTLVE
jgi:Flp pilus assembly protein TadG